MKIMIACGGTGGHVYPGIAVANEIKYRHPDWDILFVGCTDSFSIERKIVPESGYALSVINVRAFETFYSKFKKLKVALGLFGSLNESFNVIKKFKPDIVIGTGGFVCGPVVLAAKLKGLPTLIAEQNVIPGKTNKILSNFADRVCVSFEASSSYMAKPERCLLTGNPLRREFDMFDRNSARGLLKLDSGDKLILVFGGSLGAKSLNEAVIKVISDLLDDKKIHLYFITGTDNYEDCVRLLKEAKVSTSGNSNIKMMPYTNEMPKLMSAADIIVCRSGATTMAEINYIGIATIYVPLKHAANDHQRKNAMAAVNKNAAKMVEDDEALPQNLLKQVDFLVKNDSSRKIMALQSKAMGIHNSNELICDEIEKLLKLKN